MQQTEKYKLNLIEKDDVFSPDALNENARKVEEAIAAEAAAQAQARAADIAALDQRLQMLEARKMVIGSAKEGEKVYLGFTPGFLFVKGNNGYAAFFEGHVSGVSGLGLSDGVLTHGGYYSNCAYIACL